MAETATATRVPILLTWSADSLDALPAARDAVLRGLDGPPAPTTDGPFRGSLVCTEPDVAAAALRRARGLEGKHAATARPVAFLFSGVGDQYAGMGADLHATEPVFRDVLDRCCALLAAEGCDIRELLITPVERPVAPAGELRSMLGPRRLPQGPLATTRLGQVGVFVVEYALAQLLRSWGVEPAAMIGYSLGEYVAACLAGVLTLPDALRLVRWRADRIEELPPGGMLAVGLPRAEIDPWLGPDIDVAAVTSRFQTVLGGDRDSVEQLARRLTAAEVAFQRVGAHHGFHTRTMAPLGPELTAWVRDNVTLSAPQIPYLSNVTGTWITAAQATDPGYWAQHLSGTVELLSGLGALWADVDPIAIELGPGEGLASHTRHHPGCDRTRLARVQAAMPPTFAGGSERAGLLNALGRLWVAGLDIDPTRVNEPGSNS